jgi:hypothetical protein
MVRGSINIGRCSRRQRKTVIGEREETYTNEPMGDKTRVDERV